MSLREGSARLVLAGLLVGGATGASHADVILDVDRRVITGEAFVESGSIPVIDDFIDAAPFGASWSVARTASAVDGPAAAEVTGSQVSLAGPLQFSAEGTVMASASRSSDAENAGATVASSYQVEFRLTAPYAISWSAAVEADGAGAPTADPLAFAFIQLPAASSPPTVGTDLPLRSSSGSGVLPPGLYLLFGAAEARIGTPMAGIAQSGSAAFRFDVILSPLAEPVPEPATLALVAVGALAASGQAQRRRLARRRR